MSNRTLIKMFMGETYLDNLENKFEREDFFTDMNDNAEVVAILDDKSVMFATANNIYIATVVNDGKIVEFDALSRDGVMIRYNFWFNTSSVKELGNKLRKLPRKTPEEIFALPDKN